ncbi:IQ motif and ubiquitin-like domain-containing protein [Leptinotarsa decemlineata]|uniref:IQ motif and ubiquitin-like domain-containing protein n=1 Tax=Leptinotarsa decemlineata TaxID=7539 RepID=UPI003D30D258
MTHNKHSQRKESITLMSFDDFTTKKLLTVKFFAAGSPILTHAFPSHEPVLDLKKQLSSTLSIPVDYLDIFHNDCHVANHQQLGCLPTDQYGILELKILSNDERFAINEKVYTDLVVPDILTVHVVTPYETKDVVVEIENRAIEKPNLGGYKDVKTGVLHYHGYSQTGPPKPKVPPENKTHRDTQTYYMRNRKVDKEYSRATQMSNKDIYIPSITDKIMTPGPYETADEREKRLDVEGKVRTIQRYFWAWRLRKCLKKISGEYRKRLQFENEREEQEKLEDEARKRKDLVSKVFPMTMADFAMLYTMVERWKKSEISRISSMHCGASKIAEFYLLLDKEIEILRSLEKLRHKVTSEMEVKRVQDFFKAIGSPIKWYSEGSGLHIEMDTLETQRGREYFALYRTLCEKNLNTEQRLGVYAEVKSYLMNHNCHESGEILKLIDRVCELLARGIQENFLKTLEKRIEAMVLHHFKQVECNEGVTRYMNKLKEKKMEKSLLFCPTCQQLKTIDAFKLNARTDKVKTCTSCKWLDKAEEPWVDLLPFRFILKQIRNYERLQHAASSLAFILQDKDIHHIITNIWHGHSALSECNDIYQLRLCRWRKEEEWSPWNCILLTAEEAKVHLKVDKLDTVYEEEFMNHVFNKHALAKKHFKQLTRYDRHFTEAAKGDARLDEDSEYYNKPVHDCLFDS